MQPGLPAHPSCRKSPSHRKVFPDQKGAAATQLGGHYKKKRGGGEKEAFAQSPRARVKFLKTHPNVFCCPEEGKKGPVFWGRGKDTRIRNLKKNGQLDFFRSKKRKHKRSCGQGPKSSERKILPCIKTRVHWSGGKKGLPSRPRTGG